MILWLALLAPNFHQHVEPVLQKHCQTCHRPGEAAPMPLLTYEQARPWAKAIRDAVVSKRMPPWHADSTHGRFANERRMSPDEIATIRDWASQGAPKGDPRQAPKPLTFQEGWQIAPPDQIFEIPEEFSVPATGELDYVHFVVPSGFTEDRWIQQIEVRPGNRAVVHHIGVYLRLPGSPWIPVSNTKERARTRTPADEHFAMFVPGGAAQILPQGQARLIPKGADLVFQIHYQTNGKPQRDRSRIALVFAKQPPRERIHTLAVGNAAFVIPPGAPAHPVSASYSIRMPLRVLSIAPHMHLRGKTFSCSAEDPAGQRTTLLSVPAWNRNWQISYEFARPVELAEKSRVHCEATFDNSPNNPFNPDPKAEVRWGDQTREEMMVAYFELALPANADPVKLYPRRN